MCEVSLGDYSEIWEQTAHYARRKEHICSSCCTVIHKGDPYISHFSLYDGNASYEKMCFSCWWVQTKFGEAHGVTPNPSTLIDFLRECVVENERNKKGEDEWRDDLASTMARYRVSKVNRTYQRKRWAERHGRTLQ